MLFKNAFEQFAIFYGIIRHMYNLYRNGGFDFCEVILHQHFCIWHMAPNLHDWLNAKDADMEKILSSCEVTTDVE